LALRGENAASISDFTTSAPNRIPIQPGDARQLAQADGVRALGQGGDVPAPLGFVQPTEQQVNRMVILHDRQILTFLARATLTLMYR
jgi:hypothetical protein